MLKISVNEFNNLYQKVLVEEIVKKASRRLIVDVVERGGSCIRKMEFLVKKRGKSDAIFLNEPSYQSRDIPFNIAHYDADGLVVFYGGKETTCFDFVVDVNNWQRRQPSVLDFAGIGMPIIDASRPLLKNIRYGMKHLETENVLEGAITRGRFDLTEKERMVLTKITKDIDDLKEGTTGFSPIYLAPEKNELNVSQTTTIKIRQSEFVVGYNGHIPMEVYLLGGMRRLEKRAFDRYIVNKESERHLG